MNQQITPFLWFENQAEAALNHYIKIFPNSQIEQITYWPAGSPFPSNAVQTATCTLNGLKIQAFDAGPHHQFNDAISLLVPCKNQQEVDHYYSSLLEGGLEKQCGWVSDQFGVSWQIVPEYIGQQMKNGDPRRIGQMMQALLQMKKLIISELEAAYNQD